MRAWQLAAIAVATMTTHVAPASAEAVAPAGLDGGTDTGGVEGPAVQSGPQLDASYRISTDTVAATPDKAPKLRRIGSMMDFYPSQDGTGFHLSAGMHRFSRAGRSVSGLFHDARLSSLIYSPAVAGMLPLRMGLKRTSPAVSAGWTTRIAEHMAVGFEAGTTFDQGGRYALGATPGGRGWSRVDPVAQASFAWRF